MSWRKHQRYISFYAFIRKILTCFNPKIIETSKEEILIDEGCLTYPGVWLKVKRPIAIKVEFEDEKGEKHEREFQGLPSRIFQHEYDHLDGAVYVDRMEEEERTKVQPRLDELIEEFGKGGSV